MAMVPEFPTTSVQYRNYESSKIPFQYMYDSIDATAYLPSTTCHITTTSSAFAEQVNVFSNDDGRTENSFQR